MTLETGIPMGSIARMMEHSSIPSTQIYAQITDQKIARDMDRLMKPEKSRGWFYIAAIMRCDFYIPINWIFLILLCRKNKKDFAEQGFIAILHLKRRL